MEPIEIRFACDAMHGGLARWLRAAGYDATWEYAIDDARLLSAAAAAERVVVTSDGGILRRRTVRRGEIRVVFVPQGLSVDAQLTHLLASLRLSLRTPRCMHCGGELREVPRASVEQEAPPKAWRFASRFIRCSRCGTLLWRGTHWERIEPLLRDAEVRSEEGYRLRASGAASATAGSVSPAQRVWGARFSTSQPQRSCE